MAGDGLIRGFWSQKLGLFSSFSEEYETVIDPVGESGGS